MVTSPRNTSWRAEWRAQAPRAEGRRPTDATLADAERTFLDPGSSSIDRKFAALKGVPTPVANESCFPMWIPAKVLTATFSDTEIMTSLGSDQQPLVWRSSVVHLRDFKCIKNGGVSFVCTDREICTKLGNLRVTICNKNFTVQPYSKYSHWYYIDLTRMPDDIEDGAIYDQFAALGTPPVYITPVHEANGLKSRSRRVYFNQKDPPASLMIAGKTPLRQMKFTESGYCIVQHRIRAYNKEIPPFLAEQRAAARPVKPRSKDQRLKPLRNPAPPESANQPRNGVQKPPTQTEPGEGYVDSPMDSGSDHDMDDVANKPVQILVRPQAIWTSKDPPPNFKEAAEASNDTVQGRITRCKKLLFPNLNTSPAETTDLPPSQLSYPAISSPNSYEWLIQGTEDDEVSPDHDIVLHDASKNPPTSVKSNLGLNPIAKTVIQMVTRSTDVNEMSLDEICTYITRYTTDFAADDNPETILARVQAHPLYLRPLFDTGVPSNYMFLRSKVFGHAVLRVASRHELPLDAITSLKDRLTVLFPDIRGNAQVFSSIFHEYLKMMLFILSWGTSIVSSLELWIKLSYQDAHASKAVVNYWIGCITLVW
ncbi:hypothetical protein JM16_008944 [Phytophthora kernoviae]|uniref:Uncharacterized protein n=1 Tax=Phytophthora kernoviae TaxID=325452 RepID=A0A8T0LHY7_9STRA|nr:hypothetical protein JM16_008944 [Phytophthora kernoviae]